MRRIYTLKFRQKAVSRLNAGESAKVLGKKLKIAPSMIYQWRLKLGSPIGSDVKVEPTVNKFVLVYLRQGAAEIAKMIKTGKINRLDKAHIRLLLALAELEDES